MRILLLISVISCFVTTVPVLKAEAKILSISPPQGNSIQFEKYEWTLSLIANWKTSPHLAKELTLDMQLVSPSGRELLLPCFYQQGKSGDTSTWIARFAPQEAGQYRYQFCVSESGAVVDKSNVSTFLSEAGQGKGFLHPNNTWSFKFDNGKPFRGIGYNIGWESRAEDDSKFFKELHEDPKFNYREMLDRLADGGGNFFRTWMVYWNLPLDWKTPHNSNRYESTDAFFNESGAEALEALIELCEDRELYFMLALDTHVGLTGGGWRRSKYNAANGGPAEKPIDFFRNPVARDWYKSKLRYMVSRFGYSPHIAVWEFFNEVDNAMYPKGEHEAIPSELVSDWHREMAEFLNEIDPYRHLISTSVSHRSVDGMNDLLEMDFNQKHIYRNTASIPRTLTQYSDEFSKPYVIGEFGYEWDWSKNFNDFAIEMDRDYKQGLWLGLFSPTPILPMSWWWEYFEERDTNQYLENVAIILDEMLSSGNGLHTQLKTNCSDSEVTVLSVMAGDKVYLYFQKNGIQSGIPFDIGIELPEFADTPRNLRHYDCETKSTSPLQCTLQRIGPELILSNLILTNDSEAVLILD